MLTGESGALAGRVQWQAVEVANGPGFFAFQLCMVLRGHPFHFSLQSDSAGKICETHVFIQVAIGVVWFGVTKRWWVLCQDQLCRE